MHNIKEKMGVRLIPRLISRTPWGNPYVVACGFNSIMVKENLGFSTHNSFQFQKFCILSYKVN